ncbi:protein DETOXIFICATION 10-like isoform X1 [Phragmites australis]|uniref:protein DETOXIFICATION 10-like isoform X1 n=2 Tax=Phragmites australis TaxID=29695 RepID=UPI002D7810EA|nr:protein DETOXIFICATION 10-like isoform X1 [Phragmites australis]
MEERLPLLPQRMSRDGDGREKRCGRVRWWRDLAREAGKVGRVALPMAAVSVSQYAVQVASNMMVGHLPGVLPLSASAIATSLGTVSGFSLLIGMASGLETLCGQAYGAKQYDKLGLQTYRATVTLILVSIPISLLWVFIGKLLILIGQDPLISKAAGRYIIWLIPGLFAYAVSQPLTKFLQSQSLIIPMLWSSMATLLLHIPLCWLLVFKTSLGFIGASLAISLSYWLNLIMLAAYIRYSNSCKETRSPPTLEAFKGVGVFLRLALPSALMLCFEWWSFEVLILVSGLLPNPELQTSVLSICLTTISLMYTIPYGLGAAASTRVANELGGGNPEGARSAVRVVMCIAVMEAALVTSTLLASQHILGYAYSSDKEVVTYVNAMVPFVCVSVAADSLQGVLSGIARGCGWQHLGAYVNLGSFYLVGIPVALFLGFVLKMEGKGLWMGISCGSIVQFLLLAVITFFSNWQKMSETARERVFREELSDSDKEPWVSDGSDLL